MYGVNGNGTIGSQNIRVRLTTVSKLGVDNTEFNVYDTNWNLLVERIGDDVGVFLEAMGEVNYHVSVSIALLEFDESASHKRNFHGDFRRGATTKLGTSKFISWNEFNNGNRNFIKNNEAKFMLEFVLISPCGNGKH